MSKGNPGVPRHKIRIPFADRFWSKVAIVHLNDPDRDPSLPPSPDFDRCWDWIPEHRTGTQGLTGEIRLPGAAAGLIKAPRAALLLWEGVPDIELAAANKAKRHLDAGHTKCDRPQCCNPAHLAWQEHKANIHEYIRKFGKLAGRPMGQSSTL